MADDFGKAEPLEQDSFGAAVPIASDPLTTGEGMEHPTAPLFPSGNNPILAAGHQEEPHVKQQKAMFGEEGYAARAPERQSAMETGAEVAMQAPLLMAGGPEAFSGPQIIKLGRGLLGTGVGASLGSETGGRIGGMFGEGGRRVGETIGGVAGGTLGGNLASGLERLPATSLQSLRGQPGSIRPLPFGMQRLIPESLVPKGEVGSPTNPGPFLDIPMRISGASRSPALALPAGDAESVAGTRSLILTPSEAKSEATMQNIAKRRASERGMQFAAGMTPREGRKVPRLPLRTQEPEWRGIRESIKLNEEAEPEK